MWKNGMGVICIHELVLTTDMQLFWWIEMENIVWGRFLVIFFISSAEMCSIGSQSINIGIIGHKGLRAGGGWWLVEEEGIETPVAVHGCAQS